MKGKIKVLSLAVVAVLAMSAVAANAAQAASKFMTAGNVAATLSGEQVEGEKHIFTVEPSAGVKGEVKCTTAKFSGTMAAGAQETQTITPSYEKCNLNGITAVVDMNGCDYFFHSFSETSAGTFHGLADLVCPVGKHVELTVKETGTTVCTVTVFPKVNLGNIELTNMAGTPADVTLKAEVGGLEYEFDANVTNGCAPFPTGTKFTNGTYTGNTTVTAKNSLGTAVALTME
jgi:hypothetical protein